MPCKEDVKTAILNKVIDEFVEYTNTFRRISDDTIQINGRVDNTLTKAQHKAQAVAIAKNLIQRASNSFQGHIRGSIEQKSEYDPVTVTFRVNPAYIEHEFNKLNSKNYSSSPKIDYQLKSTEILASPKADEIFRKGDKNGWNLDKIMNELQIPLQQQELLKSYNTRNREQLLTNLLADYSYTIEINTANSQIKGRTSEYSDESFTNNNSLYEISETETDTFYYKDHKIISLEEYNKAKQSADKPTDKIPTQYYSNLTVPGGTNYIENEIATPAIIPSIKGHAQFATENGIGWFRSDDKSDNEPSPYKDEPPYGDSLTASTTKTRRILEVQSDLFQKGRDKTVLAKDRLNSDELYELGDFADHYATNSSENKFLQLLNKDNNWVTFFVKSIIQDSAKKGYEKVLFPSGDTAAKVEGHQTVQEFINNKQKRVDSLNDEKIAKEKALENYEHSDYSKKVNQDNIKANESEIKQLEKEIEGAKAGTLKISSIAKFYEEAVFNVLKKQGYNPTKTTDEHGNTWNEVTITDKHQDNVSLSPNIIDEQERDHINNNTSYGNNHSYSIASSDIPFTGVFEKYIQFKNDELANYQKRLDAIKGIKNSKDITTKELEKLSKEEREIKLAINGNRELGVIGLKEEIEDLEDKANVKAVSYYAEKDLDRLSKLIKSNEIKDIKEAQRIVDFYEAAGTFRRKQENPFFNEDDIFTRDENGEITDDYKLDKETRDQFSEWKNIAVGRKNTIDGRLESITEDAVNNSNQVQNTYGDKKHKFDEITYKEAGLRDTDFFSQWFLDITHGLASHNGLIPQVMFSVLVNSLEAKEEWSRGINKYTDENSDDIHKELIKLGQGIDKIGILGIKSASFNLFKQVSKEGNDTHNLVQIHTKEYIDAKSKALYLFSANFKKARTYIDYEQRNKAINRAFETLKQWRLQNSIVIDYNKLSDDSYKKELVKLLGERDYIEAIEEQNRLIRAYNSDREGTIQIALAKENKNTYEELSDKFKNEISLWEARFSPDKGLEHHNSVGGIFFGDRKENNYMNYNHFVPRKYVADIIANINDDKYEIKDTDKETGHYDKNYETIHSNTVLSNFYDKVKEFCEVMYENMPYDLQEKTSVYTLPGLMKSSGEIINEHKNGNMLSAISPAYRTMMDRFRTSFGVVKQSNTSNAKNDPITGKPNYKVNDGFLRNNSRAINDRVLIERTKFLQSFNSTRVKKLDTVKNVTSKFLSEFNPDSLALLSQYLHVDITVDQINNDNIDAIKSRLDKTSNGNDYIVDIGRLINDFSLHSVVQSQSFNLPKLMNYFSEMIMGYAARNEALPLLEILKKHYNSIENPETTNVGETIWNKIKGKYAKVGVRTGGNRQMDNYFNRVILDNYSNKHTGVFHVFNKEGLIGRTIYSSQERKEYNELTKLIENESNEKTRNELILTRDKLGVTRTATALFDNFLNWIRTLRLGYNLSSMTTNFLEGVTSNMILGATDEYFDPKEIFYGYRVIKWSFLKNISLGYIEHPEARKLRLLVDRYNIIIDNRNELQKSYSSKILDAANPYAGNQRVEYINQSPLMIAMLRTIKIKDKDGNEDSVWNATDSETGNLQEQYRTPENVENWEALRGKEYQIFKSKLEDVITLGHGNYHDLRGMMIKSTSLGKAGMMFKTWLPEAMYWRFGMEQDNIRTGKKGVKGRYLSYGAGTGLIHGAVAGAAMFGPIGALVGGGIGAGAALAFGTDSGVGMLRETIDATRLLVKKMIGMPINLIVGKQVMNINTKQWFGKGEYFDYAGQGKKTKFTIQDSKNLQANMADIAIQLAWLGLIIAVKHFFWDDDDKPQDAERQAHNILVNKLMQLSSQASMYINPVAMKSNTIESIAVIDYFKVVGKELDRVQKYFNGEDIIQTGVNAGKSGLGIQTKKMLLPGIFKDTKLGFGSQADKVYPQESPYHRYFHSKEYLEKDENKRERAAKRADLQDNIEFKGMDDKEKKRQIEKLVNDDLPTPNKLEKLGVTRKEYNDSK